MLCIELINEENLAMFQFIPLIFWVLGSIFLGGCIIKVYNVVKTTGKKLAVLGMEKAGKSTLYNMLRTGEPGIHLNTTIEEYGEFTIKDRKIKIKKGKDIGGGPEFIQYYEDLIKQNEIIIFVFNVSKYLNDLVYQRDTKDRLDFVYRKSKEYNKDMNNLVMIASHIDLLSLDKQKTAVKEVLNTINGKQYNEMFKTNFFVMSIVNKEHINKLKEKIF